MKILTAVFLMLAAFFAGCAEMPTPMDMQTDDVYSVCLAYRHTTNPAVKAAAWKAINIRFSFSQSDIDNIRDGTASNGMGFKAVICSMGSYDTLVAGDDGQVWIYTYTIFDPRLGIYIPNAQTSVYFDATGHVDDVIAVSPGA